MRDLHDGHAFVIEFAKQLHDLFTLARVQISRGLVGEQKLRFSDDSARNANQLLLAAGKLTRE